MLRRSAIASALLLCTLASAAAQAKTRAVRHPKPLPNPLYTEGGYAGATSVAQGESIALHIASAVNPLELQIVNMARPTVVLRTLTVSAPARDCTGLHEIGCKWPVTTTLDIPLDWPSGYYAARFSTSFGTRHILFVVREDQPGSTSSAVIIAATHTYQAYNTYGNKSLYPSTSPLRAHRVSYDRPYFESAGLGRFAVWEQSFIAWMTQEKRAYEVITDVDLEDFSILFRYETAIVVGHSEYWTTPARDALESFVAAGRRLAIFGGNTIWWQARLENNRRTLVVYKSAELDPETGRNNAIVTTNWFLEPVLRPENLITGSSFRNGGFTNRTEKTHPYTITNASHWLLQGTGAVNGQQFGRRAAGLEVDGALYNCTARGVEPDGSDGTPLNFEIVATVPAASGRGTIGVYTTPAGGAVFNAGTQDWALALGSDPIVEIMTRNVLDRFAQGRMAYVPVTSDGTRMRELFNCPLDATEGKLVPGWRGDEGELVMSARCGYEGASGLELAGDARIRISRDFAPTGNTMDRVVARFAVNAGASAGPADAQVDLVTLQTRTSSLPVRAARLELDPSTNRVRLAIFNPSNTVHARTDSLPLGSGWKRVEIAWRSPGAVTLTVEGAPPLSLDNPFAGQRVSEVQLSYERTALSGWLCVDALSVAPQ